VNLKGTNSDPLASIVMRSFNEAWALKETLPAIQRQEYRNWELIVIDSGSTDGSVDLIRAAAPKHFIDRRRAEASTRELRDTMMSCLCLTRFVLPLARMTKTGRVDGAFAP
jgi:glycosyltransferase involved in cell wall biosynthesis